MQLEITLPDWTRADEVGRIRLKTVALAQKVVRLYLFNLHCDTQIL